MFKIYTSPKFKPEKEWVISEIFNRLGLSYKIVYEKRLNWEIQINNRKLALPDIFFSMNKSSWLKRKTILRGPLDEWDIQNLFKNNKVTDSKIKILFGEKKYNHTANTINFGVDIFGSVFYILSGYEEVAEPQYDKHGRYPAKASLAFKEGFLLRPIVDEYINILSLILKKLEKSLNFSKNSFELKISCDLDLPYINRRNRLRNICMIILSKDISFINKFKQIYSLFSKDPKNDYLYKNILWMMDVNESQGNKVTFYFLTGNSNSLYDTHYHLSDPEIKKLIQIIVSRGHQVGIHPSYNSFKNINQLSLEVNIFKNVLSQLGISSKKIHSRQHYLRWDQSITPYLLDKLNVYQDNSLAFADHIGFRRGTCFPYKVFDLKRRKTLKLIEEPLIFMECSLISLVI